MPLKPETSPSSLAVILDKMSEKGLSLNFDFTMELATPSLRVGTVRVYGKVESIAAKRK
jgi:hypothetical protein